MTKRATPARPKKSTAEIAEALGLTTRAVTALAKERDCPVERSKRGLEFLWPEMNLWYWGRKLDEAKKAAKPNALDEMRLRRETATTLQEEIKLANLCTELMTAAEFRRVCHDKDARVAAHLKVLPTKLAPAILGLTTEAEAFQCVTPFVQEVAAQLYRADDVPPANPGQAAA